MENKIKEAFGELVAAVCLWLTTAAFIMWGWNTLAPPSQRSDLQLLGNLRYENGSYFCNDYSLAEAQKVKIGA